MRLDHVSFPLVCCCRFFTRSLRTTCHQLHIYLYPSHDKTVVFADRECVRHLCVMWKHLWRSTETERETEDVIARRSIYPPYSGNIIKMFWSSITHIGSHWINTRQHNIHKIHKPSTTISRDHVNLINKTRHQTNDKTKQYSNFQNDHVFGIRFQLSNFGQI